MASAIVIAFMILVGLGAVATSAQVGKPRGPITGAVASGVVFFAIIELVALAKLLTLV